MPSPPAESAPSCSTVTSPDFGVGNRRASLQIQINLSKQLTLQSDGPVISRDLVVVLLPGLLIEISNGDRL